MNAVIDPAVAASVQLTERAAAHVKKYLVAQSAGGYLRLAIKKTGCSGFAYVVEPASAPEAQDEQHESRGVKLLIAREHAPYLAGMQVDFVREGLNESFKFTNPNAKAMCGCGESFTV